ncbi:MAG: lipid-A-disaccharide synthase [Pseudomonadaceae bacterium]|nr:lipid-A-disaccharide synthase [Pseudomonadaceae bacterium]
MKVGSILLCAGEVSGDMLGAELVVALKKKRKGLQFAGIGGPAMAKAGVALLGGIEQFPGMGLVEVVGAIPRLKRLLDKVEAWAKEHKPAVCVTIDNQEFSARLAARLAPLGIPVVQYAAPKVWAWRQGRVHKLKKILAHVLCVFPFEADFFNRHGLAATYIGHPVVKRMAGVAKPKHKGLTLALLPGSRQAELGHHWPLFLATFVRLKKLVPQLTGLVAVESEETLARLKPLGWDDGLEAVVGEGRHGALAGCTAALTKSGTNNLELALLGVPAVVAYRMHWLTAAVVRRLVKVKFISPPNLVLDACVYPEYVQEGATEANLARAVYPLLVDAGCRRHQLDLLEKVAGKLATDADPVEAAAGVVLRVGGL